MGVKFEEIILGIDGVVRRLEVEFDIFCEIASAIPTFAFVTGTESYTYFAEVPN